MRLVFIAHDSELTGASKSMLALVEGLHQKGHQIWLMIPEEGKLSQESEKKGFKVKISGHRTNTLPKNHQKLPLWVRLKQVKFSFQKVGINKLLAFRLEKEIRAFNVDYIITNTSTTYFGYYLAKQSGVPHIWYIREFGAKDHGFIPFRFDSYKSYLKNSKYVVLISSCLQDYYNSQYALYNTKVIYNGVYTLKELEEKGDVLKLPQTIPTFIFVGQLTVSKGIWQFVKAIHTLCQEQSCKANILGEGDQYESVKDYIKENNLQNNINMRGYVSEPELYYKTSDCFIMASQSEAFGRTTIEAAVNKCFIIANRNGATKELFADGEEALFYDGSKRGLLLKIKSYLSLSSGEKNQMIDKAQKKVLYSFKVENMVDNFEKILE